MEIIDVNDEGFEKAIQDNERVVVKFYAGWCGSCRLIAPKYKKLAKDERFESVTFLEVDAEANNATRKKSGVNNLPFFATFKNGTLNEGHPSSKIELVEEMISKL